MRRLLSFIVLAGLQALTLNEARANEKQRCISASEQGQDLRDYGKYRRAREAFSACARETCPPLVRRDCSHWQSELEESWPSVIVSAKDTDGKDLADVRVLLDGEPFASRLDGKPIHVDPGEHVLRWDAEGYPAAEQHILVRAGEKNRMIDVQMGSAPTSRAPSAPEESATRDRAESAFALGGRRTSALVLGAVAVAAFGTEAYFGLTGLSDRNALMAQPCAQAATCNSSTVDSIRTKFTVADISLGVGLVSTVLAAYLYLSSSAPEPTRAIAHVDIAPLPGGGEAAFGGRF
jgi:hypothetical protein